MKKQTMEVLDVLSNASFEAEGTHHHEYPHRGQASCEAEETHLHGSPHRGQAAEPLQTYKSRAILPDRGEDRTIHNLPEAV